MQNIKDLRELILDKDADRVSLHCHAVAVDLFPAMHNPKYRGSNFSWDNFPDMLGRKCRDQVSIMIDIGPTPKKLIQDYSYAVGLDIGKNMVKLMTE